MKESYLCICSSLLFLRFTFGHWERKMTNKHETRTISFNNRACDDIGGQPDLKDGGDKQPVPLQVLLVVENMTVSQVHHQCFFCVLKARAENIELTFILFVCFTLCLS